MDPITIAAIIGGIISLITSGVGTAVNAAQQNQTNLKNEELLRESWKRDDSQMQRAKADAEAAGFSPLATLGNMPGNTNPTQMQPVQIDTNGIQNALSGTVDRVAQRKAQITQDKLTEAQVGQAEEDTRGKKLDNDLKEQTFNTKVMQEVATLNELRKKNDITDAQYWAYLADMKARGMSNEFINTMIAQKEAGYDATKQTAEKINADLNTQEERLSSKAKRIAQEALNNSGIKWGGANKDIPLDKALEEYWSKENVDVRTKATKAADIMQEALEEQYKADKDFWKTTYELKVPSYDTKGNLVWNTYKVGGKNLNPKQFELLYKEATDEFAKMYTNKVYEAQGGDEAAMWKALFTPIMQVFGLMK